MPATGLHPCSENPCSMSQPGGRASLSLPHERIQSPADATSCPKPPHSSEFRQACQCQRQPVGAKRPTLNLELRVLRVISKHLRSKGFDVRFYRQSLLCSEALSMSEVCNNPTEAKRGGYASQKGSSGERSRYLPHVVSRQSRAASKALK